jgi:hypothetical protein
MVFPYSKGLIIINAILLKVLVYLVWLLYSNIFGTIVVFCIHVFGT